MPDPTNENTGATPPETPPADEQAVAASAEQPTAVMPPAATAAAASTPTGAGPGVPWYRRRWAVVTGAIAAGVILFLGGVAVGDALGNNGRGDLGRDFRGMAPGAQGYGHEDWGDNGGGRMAPPMGQNGQGGFGHDWDDDGDHWDQGGGPGRAPYQAPGTAPSTAPSAAPQSYQFQ